MSHDILILASLVLVLIFLDRLVNVFPSLVACVIRWKESINLEASVKLGRDRNLMALLMLLPFCLVATRFRLYDPTFMSTMDDTARLGVILAVAIAYVLLRAMLTHLLRNGKISPKPYQAACNSFYTFFTMLTLCLLAMAGIMSFTDMEPEVIKNAMLWLSAMAYVVFLLRKTQIFMSSCSLFTAFSYLCALEIIPTGALTVSAFVF